MFRFVALGLAAIVVGGIATGLVLRSGGDDDQPAAADTVTNPEPAPAPEPPLPYVDGLVVSVTRTQLIMQVGAQRGVFTIPPDVGRDLDIGHIKVHARDGLPTRVRYRQEGGEVVVESIDDAPLNL